MRMDSIQIKCDMCGITRTFLSSQGNLWHHELPILVINSKTHRFGYQMAEMDLCPICLKKAVRIERIEREVECDELKWREETE